MIPCMTSFAQSERAGLCDTFLEVGPDAPTLCGDWRARDLAAHLILRERRPDAAIGMFLAPLAGRTDRIQASLAQRPFEELVDTIRSGPPKWSPMALGSIDEAANFAEFFVHHEDVLRAAPGWSPDQARDIGRDLQEALWSRLRQMGQLMFRRSPVGIVLVTPEHGRRAVKGPTKLGTVVLRGEPAELILFGTGRRDVAQVEIDGEPDAVEALRESSFGL